MDVTWMLAPLLVYSSASIVGCAAPDHLLGTCTTATHAALSHVRMNPY